MARGRSKRKFYPEFYTDEELESKNKNTDTSDTENADTEINSADISEKIESTESEEMTEEISENVNVPVSETQGIPAIEENTKPVPVAKNTGSTRKTTKTTKRSSNKVDLPSAEKNVPNNIKEKLYPSARTGVSKTSEAMFRRLDDMQRDYMEQKFATASSEIPADYDVFEEDINIEDEDENEQVSAIELEEAQSTDKADRYENVENSNESYSEKYNDYPFEDEPYKIMDITDIENAEPYNDNPYEDEAYDDDSADEATDGDDNIGTDSSNENGSKYIETMEVIEPIEPIEMQGIPESGEIITPGSDDNYDSSNEYADPMRVKYDVPHNITPFDRESAIEYAHRWALDRNPDYLNFDELGGDCTNYISQILLAGGCPMDRTPVFGWYYIDGNNKSPSWTGVEQLYKYLVKDKEFGTVAREIEPSEIEAGDIVQMSFNGKTFQHTPFIVSVKRNPDNSVSYDNVRICAHSFDSENRPLDTYKWRNIRFIRIFGHI